jgi:hypothetical protein
MPPNSNFHFLPLGRGVKPIVQNYRFIAIRPGHIHTLTLGILDRAS